jgi:hypothetical protein
MTNSQSIHRTAALLLCAVCAPAVAQGGGSEGWKFEFTPYVWGAGMDGTVRIENRPQAGLAVQQSFSDIFKILDVAAMGAIEARKDRWGVLADAVYFRVADKGSITGPLGFASLSAKGKVTQQMFTAAGAYRVNDGPSGVDVVGGLRAMSIKWDVNVTASVPVLPPGTRRLTQTKDWVDPFIGVRAQHALDERWTLVGHLDVGGFGAGSDFAVHSVLSANYAFTPTYIGKVGFRYLQVDYDKRGFQYDMTNAGLLLGLGIRW